MTPLAYYKDQCQKGSIKYDPQQIIAMTYFDQVYHALLHEANQRQGIFSFLIKRKTVTGLYLWGNVGIGKTFMMDCFYNCLPFTQKLRMHFHQFMQWVHEELKLHQGKKNPLEKVADDLASKAMVLCFDELYVSDITDAMLLGKLFDSLFKRGVGLIATSNSAPENLYKNGLQRERFLPAITLIKQYTKVIYIPTQEDYRLQHLKEAGVFFNPLSDKAEASMEKIFSGLQGEQALSQDTIEIFHRLIPIKKKTEGIIWFDFIKICTPPRSQQDFLYLADHYHTIFISNIPAIHSLDKDSLCLFVNLVDVLYDAKVRLIISSAEPIADVYKKGVDLLAYARTQSRLLEMQSEDYFLKSQE